MPYVTRVSLLGAVVALLSVATRGAENKSSFLPRSIYLPIEFGLCEHLHEAVLYQGKQALSPLPAKRIFQFTYYPSLERFEPTRTDVEVVGLKDDGERFVGKLAVTPWGVFTANQKVELNLEAQLSKLRYKIDVRYETMTLTFRCDDGCEADVVHSEDNETEGDPGDDKPAEGGFR